MTLEGYDRGGRTRKRRSAKTETTRMRIKEESMKLFMDQGYEKTTTRQILQRVGILNGSLYNIYRGKEEIFSDIVLEALNDISEQMDMFVDGEKDHVSALKYLLCTELYVSCHSPRLAELFSLTSSNWNIHKKVHDSIEDWLRGSSEVDLNPLMMRLDACMSATSSLIQRVVNEPEGFDCREGMVVIARITDALFSNGCEDDEGAVDRLLERLETQGVTVSGIRIP